MTKKKTTKKKTTKKKTEAKKNSLSDFPLARTYRWREARFKGSKYFGENKARMREKQLRREAQRELLHSLSESFDLARQYAVSDDVLKEMDKQFARIEKLFDVPEGSWPRGVLRDE